MAPVSFTQHGRRSASEDFSPLFLLIAKRMPAKRTWNCGATFLGGFFAGNRRLNVSALVSGASGNDATVPIACAVVPKVLWVFRGEPVYASSLSQRRGCQCQRDILQPDITTGGCPLSKHSAEQQHWQIAELATAERCAATDSGPPAPPLCKAQAGQAPPPITDRCVHYGLFISRLTIAPPHIRPELHSNASFPNPSDLPLASM